MEIWDNPAMLSENLLEAHAVFAEEAVSLGGNWRFLSQSAHLPLPEGWETPDFNDKKWSRIPVPGAWEAEGICPIHANLRTLPPACTSRETGAVAAEQNTVGLYRRSFILSKDQGSRQIILRFGAVRSCLLLWVNGTYIGMAKGMRTSAEFDITGAVCPEKNTVCVQVLRYSDAAYLEPEGLYQASGLLGDVTLYSLPARAITRLEADAQWQSDGTPLLHVTVNARNAEDFTARIALMDENRVVGYCESAIASGFAEALIPCPDAELWYAGHPKLYRVAVILWDGVAMHHTRELTFGFRRVASAGGAVTINGQPEKLFATEYHAFDPETGLWPSEARMEQELTQLRIHHLNAIVLTAPAPDALYGLCDRLGLYVLDRSGAAADRPLWREQALDQNARLARTYGSHPCIIAWNAQADPPGILDLNQVTTVTSLPEEAGTQTLLLSLPKVPGGLDGMISRLRDSANVLGAVFGTARTERFLGNTASGGPDALLEPDGSGTALLRELRMLLQPMTFRYDEGILTVTNRSLFRSTEGYECRCLLSRDGETVLTRVLDLEVGPGETRTLPLDLQYDIFKPGRYHMTVGYVDPRTGASVASGQWEVAHLRHIFDDNPGGTIREDQGSLLLRSENSAYTVSRASGALEQITLGDRPMLTGAAVHVFAPEEQDSGFRLRDEWEKHSHGRRKLKPSVHEVDHMTRSISASFKLGSGLIQTIRLYSGGAMAFELRLRTGKTAPGLLGLRLSLAPELDRLSWFGLGPDDAEQEHQAGRFFGNHVQQGAAAASGGKEPVYHLTVTDGKGFGLLVRSEDGLRASLRKGDNASLLQLELPDRDLKPHTTYTFGFTIQPVCE